MSPTFVDARVVADKTAAIDQLLADLRGLPIASARSVF